MTQTANDLKQELKKTLQLLRTLSDEVRVQLHLASLDARDEWKKLEPHINELEQSVEHATETTRKAAIEISHKVKAFKQSLHAVRS